MGTPDFAVPSLQALIDSTDLCSVVGVYTQPDRPAGRGQKLQQSPIKELALKNNIPVYQPENINDADEKRKLADHMVDLVVVVAYAQFLGKAVLNIPRLGCINVHSSLLPKYRGAAPIQYAILNGEKETGVTIMRLVLKMDAGPILLQDKISIDPNMRFQELHDKLAVLGSALLVKTVDGLKKSTIKDIAQDEAEVTYAKLIKKEDGLIDWTFSFEQIKNKLRAFDPWPGTYVLTSLGKLKIHQITFIRSLGSEKDFSSLGTILSLNGSLFIRCSDGWVEILELQPEGKRKMKTGEFLNGLRETSLSLLRKE